MSVTVTLYSTFSVTLAILQSFVLLAYVLFFLAYMFGYAETQLVRWLVGLDIEGLDRKTYSINLPAKVVADLVQSDSFAPKGWKVEENDSQVLVLKKGYGTGERIIVALTKNPEAPERATIMATVAFDVGTYYIKESKDASNLRDSMKNDLAMRLKENYPYATITLKPDMTDFASARAHSIASFPSESKLAVGRLLFLELPNYFKAAIILTFFGLILTPLAAYFKIGNFDYGSIFAVFFVALVAELGVAVREEIVRRREKKASWPPS